MVADHRSFGGEFFGAYSGPLEIRPGGVLAMGTTTASFDPRDIATLLAAHLQLVRKLQPEQREATIALRREDITALAELLGETTTEVIKKLGSLMGATRAQRTAMATMFAAGALVIGLASSGNVFSRGPAHPSHVASGAQSAMIARSTPSVTTLTSVDATRFAAGLAALATERNAPLVDGWEHSVASAATTWTAPSGPAGSFDAAAGATPTAFPAPTAFGPTGFSAPAAFGPTGLPAPTAPVVPAATPHTAPRVRPIWPAPTLPAPAATPADAPSAIGPVDLGTPPVPERPASPATPGVGTGLDGAPVDVGTPPLPTPNPAEAAPAPAPFPAEAAPAAPSSVPAANIPEIIDTPQLVVDAPPIPSRAA